MALLLIWLHISVETFENKQKYQAKKEKKVEIKKKKK